MIDDAPRERTGGARLPARKQPTTGDPMSTACANGIEIEYDTRWQIWA